MHIMVTACPLIEFIDTWNIITTDDNITVNYNTKRTSVRRSATIKSSKKKEVNEKEMLTTASILE